MTFIPPSTYFHFLPLFRYSSGISNIKNGINFWIAGVITACDKGKTKYYLLQSKFYHLEVEVCFSVLQSH